MIKACIFDADGTILDSMPVWEHLASSYLVKMGRKPSDDIDQIVFNMTGEESSRYLHEKFLPDMSPEEIEQDFLRMIDLEYKQKIPARPGAVSFLKYLHAQNIPLIIATTGDRRQDQEALQRLGILDCFQDILTTRDLHTDKKQPLIYITAAKKMNRILGQTAVFEDTLIPVMTAHSAGFPTVGVKDHASLKDWQSIQKQADFTIADFTHPDELLAWMHHTDLSK